ncbi:hypothetical protein [Aeromicrobium sp.]|uniref:hypothetical protein n=1 Tax=Aeromicrobium sp. TaxID=1871063 RepID=UPI002FC9376B
MSTTSAALHADPHESATAHRIGLLAAVLAIASIAAVIGGLLWPEPSGGGETYAYADIADQRELWWGLLTGLAIIGILGTTLQAMATMYLVRHRGSTWATIGAALLIVGIIAQGVGVAGWATAYFFPTDPSLDPAAGHQAFKVVNDNIGYVFTVMITGAALAIVGQIAQAIGLLRAKVVPVWIPIGLLTAILTFLVPGNGVIGLITALPMAIAACALGWYAYRRTSAILTVDKE